jgi:hypothetical protein
MGSHCRFFFADGGQGEPEGAMGSQEEPGGAGRSQGESGAMGEPRGAMSSQEGSYRRISVAKAEADR